MHHLTANKKFVPEVKVLRNYLARHPGKQDKRLVNPSDLSNFCSQNENVPENVNTFYVVKYEIVEEGPKFRIFMSTRRLLENATYSHNIATDATYKLNFNGYPVFLYGFIDKKKKFHAAGIMLATNEGSEDYSFGFAALKEGVAWLFGFTLEPKVLIADSADAIAKGFEDAFDGNFVRVNCWAHVIRAYSKRIVGIDDATASEIKDDIYKLQLSSSLDIFQVASQLWIKKWENRNANVQRFVEYFTENWINANNGWYEGAAPGHPSTNNGLEAVNRILKDEYTHRRRLPLGELLFFAAEDCSKVTRARVNQLMNPNRYRKWKHFSDFLKSEFTVWKATWDEADWRQSHCTCPVFLNFACKHFFGIAAMKKLTHFSLAAKNIPLGEKRRRGRPKGTTSALRRQD